MPWLRLRFDGEGLAFAKLTRFARTARAHIAVDDPGPERVYPTHTRLTGLGRLTGAMVKAALTRQYGPGVEVARDGNDLLVRAAMPEDRLWSAQLQRVRTLGARFWPPYIIVDNGAVTMYARPLPGEDAAKLAAQAFAAGIRDVAVLRDVDLEPWLGLEPTPPGPLQLAVAS